MALILVIDDDEAISSMVRDVLTMDGHEVKVFADGSPALDYLKDPASPMPAAILTDIMMPGLDGEHLSGMLSADKRTARIPLIVMTAKGKMRPLFPGAAAFIEKPFNLGALRDAVRKAVGA